MPVLRSLCGIVTGSLIVLGGSLGRTSAAIITYAPPPIVGPNVTYTSVSESSSTDALPLYGAPTASGNNLVFSNLNFSSTSISGSPPLDFTDGQLNFTLAANAGSFLTSLNIVEFGDYNVSATPLNPAAIDYVKVYPQALQITVLDVNGVPLATPLVDNTSVALVLSPSGGDFQTGVDPSIGNWSGLASANLTNLFGSNKITRIAISYDNQLLAVSQFGGIGTISKKGVDIDPGISSIPEPTTAAIVFVSAGLFANRRRRV